MSSISNNDEFINSEQVLFFNKNLIETEKSIRNQVLPNLDKPKIIYMGKTGYGKTSLACCLSGQDVYIEILNGRPILKGIGIGSGNQSVTIDPSISYDQRNELINCDCPGFQDTKGVLQEIFNAFAINSLFENSKNCTERVKILLVVSDSDFQERLSGMRDSIDRLKKMFPNKEQLKSGIGLVISKSVRKMTINNYVNMMNDNPPDDMIEWTTFFRTNQERIFLFPKPSRKDEGKIYKNCFTDYDKLLTFIKNDYLINPQTSLSLSKEAKLTMENLRNNHLHNISGKANDLLNKINRDFQNEKEIVQIEKWIKIIQELILIKNVKYSKDFIEVIKKYIPNSEKYNNELTSFAEYEIFDKFIDKTLHPKENTSCLNEVIRAWSSRALIELEANLRRASEKMYNEKVFTAQQKALEEGRKIEEKYRYEIQRIREELKNHSQEQEMRIQKLQNEINEKNKEISRLQNRSICHLI